MRVIVETLDTVIEGDVIGGEPLDGVSGDFNLDAEFTVRCDDGQCFSVHGWMIDVEVVREAPKRSDSPRVTSQTERTVFLRRPWPALLICLWREQHPKSHNSGRWTSLMFSLPHWPSDFSLLRMSVARESSAYARGKVRPAAHFEYGADVWSAPLFQSTRVGSWHCESIACLLIGLRATWKLREHGWYWGL